MFNTIVTALVVLGMILIPNTQTTPIAHSTFYETEYWSSVHENMQIAMRKTSEYFEDNFISRDKPFSYLEAMKYFRESEWTTPAGLPTGAGGCEYATLLYRGMLNFAANLGDEFVVKRDQHGNDILEGNFLTIIKKNHYEIPRSYYKTPKDKIVVWAYYKGSENNIDFYVKFNKSLPKNFKLYYKVWEDERGIFHAELYGNYDLEGLNAYYEKLPKGELKTLSFNYSNFEINAQPKDSPLLVFEEPNVVTYKKMDEATWLFAHSNKAGRYFYSLQKGNKVVLYTDRGFSKIYTVVDIQIYKVLGYDYLRLKDEKILSQEEVIAELFTGNRLVLQTCYEQPYNPYWGRYFIILE